MCADLRVTDLVAALKESERAKWTASCKQGFHKQSHSRYRCPSMGWMPSGDISPCQCPCHQEAQK